MCVISLVKSQSCLLYSTRPAAIAHFLSDTASRLSRDALAALRSSPPPRRSTSLSRSTAAKAASQPPNPNPSRYGRPRVSSEPEQEEATLSRAAAVHRSDFHPSCRSRIHRTFPSCPSTSTVPSQPSSSCSNSCASPSPPSLPSSTAQTFPSHAPSSSESKATPRSSPDGHGRKTRKDRVREGVVPPPRWRL